MRRSVRRAATTGAVTTVALAAVAVCGVLISLNVSAKDLTAGATALVAQGNHPPEFEYPPYHQVPPGKEIAFGLHAIDQDGDVIAVELVEKPASASYDPVTLTVRWKPTAKDAPAGRFLVKVTETQRQGGAKRAFTYDFGIAVVAGARAAVEPPPLGPAVELLITIHDAARLAQVNKDWPLTKVLDVVRRVEGAKVAGDQAKRQDTDAKTLYADMLGALALRHNNNRLNPTAKEFDKKAFGDPAAWKIVTVRPRLDKLQQELRIVYQNEQVAEPVYVMFRFRLVRDLPPGELPAESLDLNNKEFTRLTYEAFFTGDALNPKFVTDKKAHGKAVSAYVGAVLSYQSDKPHMGTEFLALPTEARFGGGSLRDANGAYVSGDGWAWAVIKAKWIPVPGAEKDGITRLALMSIPIPGFTTEIAPSADKGKWTTVCAPKFDPDNPKHTAGWEVLCRKKQGFTDLPVVDASGKVSSGAIDAANLYVDHKRGDMVATVALDDPRRDNFEENGMTCSQCHVRSFANGDLRDAAVRDPKAKRMPAASPPIATTFFNIVPEETWRPFTIEFQRFQECLFRDAIRRYQGVETKLTCPLVAE